MRKALGSRDDAAMREALEGQLQILGDRSGTPVVTEEHRIVAKTARNLGAAAKVSGAGGGDGCVAIGRPEAIVALEAELRSAGLLALRLRIDGDGARSD